MTSWRTTTLGIVAIISAVINAAQALVDGNPQTVVDLDATLAAIAAGAGLIVARDNKVSSEQAGAN